MPLPPDRSHVRTEQPHDRSASLDTLDTRTIVSLLAEDTEDVRRAVAGAAEELAAFVDELVPRVTEGGRLVYLGAGTSGRLGVLDAAECPPTFQSDPNTVVGVIAGGDGALRRSSEGAEDDPDGAATALDELRIGPRDTLLGIAAGGTTPYVLGAFPLAAARGAATALLTCAPRRIPPDCGRLLLLDTGPEILTGSTRLKAGSATKLALNAITTALFVRLGKTHGNLMVDLRATNDKLLDRAIRTLRSLHPPLDRPGAAALLDAAGGSLKTAAVMALAGTDRAEADARLHAAGGRLRAALESR